MSKRSQTIHIPQYLHHKSSGTARVRIAGKEHSLGKFDSPSSYAKYDRLIDEWRAAGCPKTMTASHPRIDVIILKYLDFANGRYRPRSLDRTKHALRALRESYGDVRVCDFGPKSLKTVVYHLEHSGRLCRKEINARLSAIKHVFKWAASEELISQEKYQSMLTVEGLKQGKTTAHDYENVKPVPVEHVDMIEPFVSRQVWAVIQLQLLTGARGGEILCMRPVDVDTSGNIWTYQPSKHKNAHRGHHRRIYIGPKGKEILQPFLHRKIDAYCFSPAESECERRMRLNSQRRTPLSCGNKPGSNQRSNPKKQPGKFYTAGSYLYAIRKACDKAFPPPSDLARRRVQGKRSMRWETDAEWRDRLGPDRWNNLKRWQREHRWHPHQLRHSAATYLRKEFGLDAARIILGHRSAAITETYAERDEQIAIKIMMEIG